MQFALQALPFSRHAQNDRFFGHLAAAPGIAGSRPRLAATPAPLPSCPPCQSSTRNAVRILRNEGSSQGDQGGRLLISGRMADVCAALNRMAFNEYACG